MWLLRIKEYNHKHMKNTFNTHWSSPSTSLFAGLLSLRSALASGNNAELIRLNNEDCQHPIMYKDDPKAVNFRGYKFQIGYQSTYNKILEGKESPWNQELTLNYTSVFGTEEAMNHYYKTGELSDDNSKGMGRNHLVKVDDLIAFYKNKPAQCTWEHQRAASLYAQYRDPATRDKAFFYDFFQKEHGNEWLVKKFKHKLWVVNMLDKDQPRVTPLALRILNVLIEPLMFLMKYTPRKDVLRMKEYTNITYRVGGITNGFSVQFQIPKAFSFK
jgi:hypothetical protein